MMRVQRLDLDFFGHFTGKSIAFGDRTTGTSDFHLIYGSNEAGKTTIMEGFLRLLYGFPLRESYAFKHSRANLRISAALQIDGTTRGFTRLPSQKNNLVDESGAPLPEAALQGALSGLSLDEYKQLLCLDDTTIEKGGEEIANSKGDIGRLLFSAAAGVSDLSEVLDASKARSEALYKKGGSKSEYAQLKRALDDVNGQIRAKDINVTEYRKRKQTVEAAEAAEGEVRARRLELMERLTRLRAQTEALSKYPAILDLERELAPLNHFPADLDIDPESLVKFSTERALHVAEQARLRTEIQEMTQERGKIEEAPEAQMSLMKLEDLKDLRSRCGHAATDLPRRRVQRDDVLRTMQLRLAEGGFGAVAQPEKFAIDAELLGALEKSYQAKQDAEKALKLAQDEQVNAQQNRDVARSELGKTPEVEGESLRFSDILEQQNAQQTLTDAQKAQEAIRLATRKADDALSQLSLNGRTFSEVPPLPLRSDDATRLERSIEAAVLALEKADLELATAREAEEKLTARIRFEESSGGLISDEDAQAARRDRDGLWQAHLGEMSPATAQEFETAMRLDDAKGETRLGQAGRLGALRELKTALCDAQSVTRAKDTAYQKARVAFGELQTTLECHLREIGLNPALSPAGFADWMRLAETAQGAVRELALEHAAAAPDLESAADLHRVLVQALELPDAKLSALVALASKAAGEQEKAKMAQMAAQKAFQTAEREVERRQKRVAQCEAILSAAQSDWTTAKEGIPSSNEMDLKFPQAFEALRDIREQAQKLSGLTHQIAAMEADEAMLATEMKTIVASDPALDALPAKDVFDVVEAKAIAASQARDQRDRLLKEIDAAQVRLAETTASIAAIDAQVELLAEIFPESIARDTIEHLREAVLQGNRAIRMRAQRRDLVNALCSVLEVGTRAEAEAQLSRLSLSTVEAARQEAKHDLESIEAALTTAIEERTQAQAHLKAIGGDDEVATLNARKQTLELELETVARRYLELRLGHMLADGAIRRYRDTHRSSMMQAAEVAFSELTNGAYCGLRSQIDGANESLVAIQTSDKAAKEAQDMSKGTRFQLYLALRAAAYEQMASNGTTLPFICDDIFETFDEDRTRSACKLLRRIGQTGQAIYLTHHQHVVDIAQEVCAENVKVHRI